MYREQGNARQEASLPSCHLPSPRKGYFKKRNCSHQARHVVRVTTRDECRVCYDKSLIKVRIDFGEVFLGYATYYFTSLRTVWHFLWDTFGRSVMETTNSWYNMRFQHIMRLYTPGRSSCTFKERNSISSTVDVVRRSTRKEKQLELNQGTFWLRLWRSRLEGCKC